MAPGNPDKVISGSHMLTLNTTLTNLFFIYLLDVDHQDMGESGFQMKVMSVDE